MKEITDREVLDRAVQRLGQIHHLCQQFIQHGDDNLIRQLALEIDRIAVPTIYLQETTDVEEQEEV